MTLRFFRRLLFCCIDISNDGLLSLWLRMCWYVILPQMLHFLSSFNIINAVRDFEQLNDVGSISSEFHRLANQTLVERQKRVLVHVFKWVLGRSQDSIRPVDLIPNLQAEVETMVDKNSDIPFTPHAGHEFMHVIIMSFHCVVYATRIP